MENPNLTENTVPHVLEGEYCRKHHGGHPSKTLRKLTSVNKAEVYSNWGNKIENIALVTLENSVQNTITTISVSEYVKNDYGQHVENNAVKVLENI
jgi:hypothetical protein